MEVLGDPVAFVTFARPARQALVDHRSAIADRVVGPTNETPEQALAAFAASDELRPEAERKVEPLI